MTSTTESRTPFLHNIQLHDAQGKVITPPAALTDDGKPQDSRATPYSPAQTCGKCHDYATISQGWHFEQPPRATSNPVAPANPGSSQIPPRTPKSPFSYRGLARHI